MIMGYKDRWVEKKQSKVYYNLHRHLFSIKQRGLVVLHAHRVKLTDVTFQVNEAGRQRVLEEQRKNVHAYVNGVYQGVPNMSSIEDYREAYYNPRTTSVFVDKETWEPLYNAQEVILADRRIYYR
jgi:adenosine deaminase